MLAFSCGAGALGIGSVIFWMLNAADGAAGRAAARERRRKLSEGL